MISADVTEGRQLFNLAKCTKLTVIGWPQMETRILAGSKQSINAAWLQFQNTMSKSDFYDVEKMIMLSTELVLYHISWTQDGPPKYQ